MGGGERSDGKAGTAKLAAKLLILVWVLMVEMVEALFLCREEGEEKARHDRGWRRS